MTVQDKEDEMPNRFRKNENNLPDQQINAQIVSEKERESSFDY